MNRLACLLVPALFVFAPGCVQQTNIAIADGGSDGSDGSDVVMPDVSPDTVDRGDGGGDGGDGGACPAEPEAAIGMACAEEGRTCGMCPPDPCSFCNLVQCQLGHWQRVESFPDPRCADAGDAGDAADARGDGALMEGTCATMPVSDVPARQTVHFQFPAGASGYVVTGGNYCGALRLERGTGSGATGVTLGLGYQCICECPAPPPPSYTAAHALAGAAPFVLDWDARGLATCTSVVDCAMRGWPGVPPATEVHGGLQPLGAGHYRATFALIDTLPPRCAAGADGAVTCSPALPMGPPGGAAFDVCPAERTVTVEFDLPASGDVTVPVVLP